MRENIPKLIAGVEDITAEDLLYFEPTPFELNKIHCHVKQINRKKTLGGIFAIIAGTFFSAIFLIGSNLSNDIIPFSICFAGMYYLVGCLTLVKRIDLKKPLLGIQKGVVNGIWSYKTGSNKNRIYYTDVLFPESRTRLKKVCCTKKDFDKAQKGDQILVFTYDNKNAYGIMV